MAALTLVMHPADAVEEIPLASRTGIVIDHGHCKTSHRALRFNVIIIETSQRSVCCEMLFLRF